MSGNPDQQQYSRKLGSAMTLLAWIILLAILTSLFSGYLDTETNPNVDVISISGADGIEIILAQNRAGHYVATAALNGSPVDVIIDTGATDVSVPAAIAARIGLRRGAVMEVSTANGTIPVYATTIDTIQVGDMVLHKIRATINPYMDEQFVLLGMSFLNRIEFTQKQGQLILKQVDK